MRGGGIAQGFLVYICCKGTFYPVHDIHCLSLNTDETILKSISSPPFPNLLFYKKLPLESQVL